MAARSTSQRLHALRACPKPISSANFVRRSGKTPHRYLQRRRVERALYLLRCTDRSITDICFDVGFASLGTFSKTFHLIVGESPSEYRRRGEVITVPTCFAMAWTRPSSFGEDNRRMTG